MYDYMMNRRAGLGAIRSPGNIFNLNNPNYGWIYTNPAQLPQDVAAAAWNFQFGDQQPVQFIATNGAYYRVVAAPATASAYVHSAPQYAPSPSPVAPSPSPVAPSPSVTSSFAPTAVYVWGPLPTATTAAR